MEASLIENLLSWAHHVTKGEVSRMLEEAWNFFFVNRQELIRASRQG